VSLDPLPPAEFPAWAAHSRRGYVAQQVRSGALPADDARARAAAQQAALLPRGLRTPGHHIWSVRADGEPVGSLWIQIRSTSGGPEAYVYDVELAPRARGRGLGRATMLAAEHAVRGLGATRMRLNVFAHNTAALRLYDGLGYTVLRTLVTRRLDGTGGAPYDAGGGVTLERRAQVNPGHEVWTAVAGEADVGSVCLHPVQRSDGLRVDGHDLTLGRAEHGTGVLAACELHCRALGATSLALWVAGPGVLQACRRVGFEVTAQLREKPLTS
jgi:ribosomal protein S18 acetylase RimI-like enzyme